MSEQPILRYVVQEHVTDPHHFDLMFERDGVLWTWSAPDIDGILRGEDVTAVRNFDHRMKYLDYEGLIEGKGYISIVGGGSFAWVNVDDDAIMLSAEDGPLAGDITAARAEGRDEQDRPYWTLTLRPAHGENPQG